MGGTGPRQHHIIPAFYLAGFTDTGTAAGRVHVFDYLRTKSYRASPSEVCRERDFYRIYEPGEDAQALEREMARIEGEIAPVFAEVVSLERVREAEHLAILLSLAALIHVRHRGARASLSAYLAESLRDHLARGAIDREKWERIRESEIRAGTPAEQLPNYDDAVRLVREGSWAPPAPRILQVGMIPDLQRSVLEMLVNMPWELLITEPATTGGFITSDGPVVWGSLFEWWERRTRRLAATQEAEVTFPITKSLALASHPSARRSNLKAPKKLVAYINSRTLQFSQGLLFYASAAFPLLGSRGRVATGADYLAYVRRARRDGMLRP